MANTLPGTPYVESSDLVANYPAVSESLAERIDEVGVLPFADSTARGTALPTPTEGQYSYLQDTNSTEYWDGAAWVAAGVAPGLVHINTTTFSAVSSVSLNDVFTATYDNYVILCEGTAGTAGLKLIRMRLAGSDISTGTYDRQLMSVSNTSFFGARETNQTAGWGCDFHTSFTGVSIIVYGPAKAEQTMIRSSVSYPSGGAGIVEMTSRHQTATAYDGFSIVSGTGNISGIIRVYGYKNS